MPTRRPIGASKISVRAFALGVLPLAGAGLLLARAETTGRAAPSATSASAGAPEYVTYKFGAAQWLSVPRSVEMSQGVTFGQDDATLKTDAAVALLDKDQNLVSAQAQGPVHLFDPQDDLTGLHGTIDFTHHLARLTDSIVLVVKPGKREASAPGTSLRKQFRDPATLTCQAMTYDYKRKIGRVPGPLTVRQVIQTKDGPETRTLTADAGLYNGNLKTIQLVGDIRGDYSSGSHISGDTRPTGRPVVIGIKEGAEYINVPFPLGGYFPVKSRPGGGKSVEPGADDVDLSVPTPPPSNHSGGPDLPPASVPPAPAAPPPSGAIKPPDTAQPSGTARP